MSVQRNLNILGLRYLHEHLLAHGHDSRLLFLNRYDDENAPALERLRAFIAEFNPGMVGVSLTAYDYPHARPFSVRCKQWFPEIPLVWGGIHPTTEPEDSLNYADLIVRGEGEGALLDLVTAMEAGTSPDNIDNLGFRRGGETRLNPVRPLIQDLDALPMLTQVPAAAWIHPGLEVEPLTLRHVRKYKMFRGAIYRIMVSRGCPMHCAYCANSFLKGLYPDM
ncbi:MAG TPA: cobalamin-dependent protein, partial [Candidatus Hydrogenedentes bacterium]|nr:cobalamin-dependent protein [Candidatus Hydrogenedentota bacterium]